MKRTTFLAGMIAVPFLAAAYPALADARDQITLSLARDSENVNAVLANRVGDQWVLDADGYAQLNQLLRDKRANVVEPMSPKLLVALADIQSRANGATIIITSGLRTPATNAATEGAARDSRHMHRDAVDCLIDGLSMERLFAVASTSDYCGGLGLYGSHVHVDTWNPRTWEGR